MKFNQFDKINIPIKNNEYDFLKPRKSGQVWADSNM